MRSRQSVSTATLRSPRMAAPRALKEAFFWEKQRNVDASGVLHLEGSTYEVDATLSRKKVTVRYDPYDLSVITALFEEKLYPATPLNLRRRRSRDLPREPEPLMPQEGIDYLSLVGRAHEQRQKAAVGRLKLSGEPHD